jgi:putative DNA primase/helicase
MAISTRRSRTERQSGSSHISPGPDEDVVPSELTDLENARRFAKEHQGELRYVGKWRRWLVWDGKRWRQDDTHQVQRRAKATVQRLYEAANDIRDSGEREKQVQLAVRAQHAGRIASMIDLAKSEPGVPIIADELDSNPWLLNVDNGTIDLKTGKLHKHRRADLITKLAPVRYNPAATCPTWDWFLGRVMASRQDLIRYLQKAVGYGLTGDTREQCLFVAYGLGANGKSTLLGAVTGLLGEYAQQTPTQTLLLRRNDSIPNDLARLRGARFVTAVEAESDRKLAEGLVKQMTGGDKIAARFLHGEFFEFTPTFKLFLAVNHKPVIQGTDYAIWRRMRLIPFTVTIPESEQDKTLPDKLMAERAGILRWAIEGCLAWRQEGLTPPEVVTQATKEYRAEMDPLQPFIDAWCYIDPKVWTPAKLLYDQYVEWCRRQEETPIAKGEVGTRLSEKGFKPDRTKSQRIWWGLVPFGPIV